MSESRWSGRGKIVAAIVALGLGATLFAVAGPAQGQGFPGTNGQIVYDFADTVRLINPNSPIPQILTQSTDGLDSARHNREANKLAADNDNAIVTFAPTVGAAITLVPGTAGAVNPSFNPDTTKVAYQLGADVFTIDLTGANKLNLTGALPDTYSNPDWSPAGAHIVMQNNTNFNLSRIDATGGGLINAIVPAAQACAAATPCQSPTFDPTSALAAFDQDGAPEGIFTVLANGTSANATRQTTGNHDNADWAPDAKLLVFENNTSGNLNTVPSNGSQLASDLGVPGDEPNWGVAPPPPSSPTPTPVPAVVSISLLSDTAKTCTFQLSVTPAGATGVTADVTRTKKNGTVVVGGDNVAVPGTVTVDKRRKKKTWTLSGVVGGTGSGTVECGKKKK